MYPEAYDPREWSIPLSGGGTEKIIIDNGDRIFVVGPNGVGKSALIQQCAETLRSPPMRRVLAHRQTWMESSSIDLTPRSRRNMQSKLSSWDAAPQSRWHDSGAAQRLSTVLFDLVAAENQRYSQASRSDGLHIYGI